MNLPPTPDERPHVPRLVAPPQSAVVAGDTVGDETMEVTAEAGVSTALGAAVPQTPHDVQQSDPASGSSLGDAPLGAETSAVVHPRDGGDESERPSKHQRILAVIEHEDQPKRSSTVRTLMSLNPMILPHLAALPHAVSVCSCLRTLLDADEGAACRCLLQPF